MKLINKKNKMKKLVIAEKPSMGRDIASVIEPNGKTKDGYIEGNNYIITWCYGHLVGLSSPKDYCENPWDIANLPILPTTFKWVKGEDPGKKKQIKTILNLLKECSGVINACDAGREGEAIFRYLVQEIAGSNKPMERLWINSLTNEAIAKGFNNLKPLSDYNNLYLSAVCRDQSDWIVGMGVGTPALTHQLKKQKPDLKYISVGRVFTPTFAMVCKRYLENKNFIPTDYFKIRLTAGFIAESVESFTTKEQADQILLACKNLHIEKITKTPLTEQPPLLFDLTTLQKKANERYSYSADLTLKTAQELYESKYITYPRTDSRYIGEDLLSELPTLVTTHITQLNSTQQDYINKLNNYNRKSVNASKVTDHHAILPTTNHPKNLSPTQKNIYNLILTQFFIAISEAAKKEKTSIQSKSANHSFITNSTVTTYPGYLHFTTKQERDEKEDEQPIPLFLEENTLHTITNKETLAKQTTPKPIYTESSLLTAMENCGKELEDKEHQLIMKGSGIGTPATRSSIIEKLFHQKLVIRKGKSLIPTEFGLWVYDFIKDYKISSAELTGEFETQLNEVKEGRLSKEEFIKNIHIYAKQLTQEILSTEIQSTLKESAKISCPKCSSGKIFKGKKAYGCSNWNAQPKCDFTLWPTIAGKKLTDKNITDLLTKGYTSKIKGFKNKAGKPFEAVIELNKETLKTTFKF